MRKYKSFIVHEISKLVELDFNEIYSAIEEPPSREMGDLAFPCFVLSKKLKKAPNKIAEELCEKIKTDSLIEKLEAKGPYLNFFINKKDLISSITDEISKLKFDYGKNGSGKGKTIVLEYSSPNIAKPFGIGHLRSTVLGMALKNIYKHLDYNVVSINHFGDWGTQFGKLVFAYKKWGDENKLKEKPIEHLFDLYVKVHKEEETDSSITDLTREEFKKLEEHDPENLALWEKFSELSKEEFGKIYQMLGVEFDSEIGESFYIDKISDVEKDLKEKSLLKESQEAAIVDLEKYGMPPMLVRKSDDTTLYATRDLAAAIYRKQYYNFDKMLYVVNVAQSLYFKQLFKVLEIMGHKWHSDCHHVSFGWVKLGDEMMSTRRGNTVFLEDVIAKTIEKTKEIIKENSPDMENADQIAFDVGIGSVIFADLAYRKETDISFDWDRMLDFRGNSGPYIQYTHARICSVIRKYKKEVSEKCDPELLQLPEEYILAKMLSQYPDIIEKSANEFEPYYISNYLLDICRVFNTYYQKYKDAEDKILSSNLKLAEARMSLINCARIVLQSGLSLLGIKAPQVM